MTTQDVANRFMELCKSFQWEQAQNELFAPNAVSIEPENSPTPNKVEGLEAIREKGRQWGEMVEETHGGYLGDPIINGNHFSVAMGMDVTMKGAGRNKMDEIAVYEVRDGKIVKEQFFY